MLRFDTMGIPVEAPTGPWPYGRLIDSNPLGSGNGSPGIAAWANDAMLGMYAVLAHFGITPNDVQEQVGNSDLVRVFQAVNPVGSIIHMAIDTDPATLDIRALVCDGSTVSEVTYADLFAVIGTTWNTGGEPGGQFRLPAFRGKFLRCFDDGAGVDIGRVFAASQASANLSHRHKLASASDAYNSDTCTSYSNTAFPAIGVGGPMDTVIHAVAFYDADDYAHQLVEDTGGPESNPINETVYALIRY